MSTVYYSCTRCGNEVGSAQEIVWQGERPFHPDCAAPLSEEDNLEHDLSDEDKTA